MDESEAREKLHPRIFSKLSFGHAGGCVLWEACRDHDGYGVVRVGKYKRRAHRVIYELVVGPVPRELVCDHLCRVTSCVNPKHIEIVTNKENIVRGVKGVYVVSNSCAHGHAFTAENTKIKVYKGKPRRICRACLRAYKRSYYLKSKLANTNQVSRAFLFR